VDYTFEPKAHRVVVVIVIVIAIAIALNLAQDF
jgi:hypothetical protein